MYTVNEHEQQFNKYSGPLLLVSHLLYCLRPQMYHQQFGVRGKYVIAVPILCVSQDKQNKNCPRAMLSLSGYYLAINSLWDPSNMKPCDPLL